MNQQPIPNTHIDAFPDQPVYPQSYVDHIRAQRDELLAALKVVMEHVDSLHDDPGNLASKNWHWFNAARAALAKATGEPV